MTAGNLYLLFFRRISLLYVLAASLSDIVHAFDPATTASNRTPSPPQYTTLKSVQHWSKYVPGVTLAKAVKEHISVWDMVVLGGHLLVECTFKI